MRYKLLIGGVCLIALGFIAVFPGLFSKYPRGYQDILRSIESSDGTVAWRFAPEAPSDTYHFGSDNYGYDIQTRILWGLRWTLACVIIVALSRTLIGGAAGVLRVLVFGVHGSIRTVSPMAVIPSFVFVFFLLYPMTINSPLGSLRLLLFQCAVMTIFDLGGIISSISLKTEALMKTSFFEGAVSCGANRLWLAKYHIVPFLATDLIEAFATQTVAVLQLVGRLGVFSLFVGGTIMTLDPVMLSSASGEVAGLIGQYRGRLQGAQWMLLYPLGTYLVILGSLRLFVSGLHDQFKKLDRTYY
ncbi:MAG TPA: hypothetical protein VMX33_00565 [bacterium]|nr:hypothetical protein [bacterium]